MIVALSEKMFSPGTSVKLRTAPSRSPASCTWLGISRDSEDKHAQGPKGRPIPPGFWLCITQNNLRYGEETVRTRILKSLYRLKSFIKEYSEDYLVLLVVPRLAWPPTLPLLSAAALALALVCTP